MGCHRRGCDDIMCNTYVDSVGYICYDCQNEFESFVAAKNKIRTEDRLFKWLEKFMKTTPNRKYGVEDAGITVEDFFLKYKIR
ncbi:MAG TPA: hypothetical protein VLA48_02765 [Nitrososphaeraceae archaeon]|nr:hypothetical protein [Nitrososphaeraceae archaeon]